MKFETAKVSVRGKKQIILLPESFGCIGDELYIRKEGQNIILFPKRSSWKDFFEKVPLPSEDFMQERVDNKPQKREDMF